MALDWLKAVRTIDRLLSLEQKHTALIAAQAKEIEALKDRVAELEARCHALVPKIQSTEVELPLADA